MPARRKRKGGIWLAPLTAFLVVGILAFIAFSGSATFNDCQNDEHSQHAAQEHQEIASRFLVQFVDGTFARCTGSFISNNQGEIGTLAAVVVAFFTFTLWFVGGRQLEGLRDSIDKAEAASEVQSADMQKSVREATRAANAMEGVGTSLVTTAQNSIEMLGAVQKQMRAYITVGNGQLWAQNILTKFKLQMDTAVVNVGFTPARRVVVRFNIKILPHPLPNDFDLDVLEPQSEGGTLNPRHPYTYATIAEDIYPEELVWKTIVLGNGFALYVWGTVWYDDVYGVRHHQNYCQWCLWKDAGISGWINGPRHNDGT